MGFRFQNLQFAVGTRAVVRLGLRFGFGQGLGLRLGLGIRV